MRSVATITAVKRGPNHLQDDKIKKQLSEIMRITLPASAEKAGWQYEKPVVTETGIPGGYTYTCNVKVTKVCNRHFSDDVFSKQLESVRRRFFSAGKRMKWINPEDVPAVKVVARAAAEADEPKTLGEVNLIPGNSFDRVFGLGAQTRRTLDALTLAHRTGWTKRRNTLFDGTPGCHQAGTVILRADGSEILVENVQVGDRLLAHNGYRTVQSLVGGHGAMYRINPVKGEPFIVNEDHILTLVRSRGKRHGDLLDVSVKEWLQWSRTRKSNYKLVRSGVIEYERQQHALPIPAYTLGVFLGDATLRGTPLHEDKHAIIDMLAEEGATFGIVPHITKENDGGIVVCMSSDFGGKSNPYIEAVRALGLEYKTSGNKFIPDAYKYASVADRQRLLAGYIDTDGEQHGGVITISSKSYRLITDSATIARSLGLAAYISTKTVMYNDSPRLYWVLNLSGDLAALPIQASRKQAKERKQIKSVRHTGFTAESCGVDQFFGFVLDGDHRYLMGDFTITHNCGKTELMRAFATMLGKENEAYRWFDATSMTKAGAVQEIINSKIVPPVLFIEEIEKCEESALRFLLGVMDTRGEIRRLNYRTGPQCRNVRMVVIATANDVRQLKKVMSGALYSRFQNRIYFPEPDRTCMAQILGREVQEIGGRQEWIEPTLKFAYDKWGMRDPRDAINVVSCGGSRLLTGDYQHDYEETMHPFDRSGLVRAMRRREKLAARVIRQKEMVEKTS